MPPDGLKQPLGGKTVLVAQAVRGAALAAPDGVKIFAREFTAQFFARLGRKVKAVCP